MTTTTSRPATLATKPIALSPDGSNTPRSTTEQAPPIRSSSVEDSAPRLATNTASPITPPLDGAETSRVAACRTSPNYLSPRGDQPADRHPDADTPDRSAVGSNVGPDPAAICPASPIKGSLLDPALALAADVLDDLERVRIANENRLRQLTRTDADVDGGERGFGLTEGHPDVLRLAVIVDALVRIEHDATLNLQRLVRRHPLGAWVKANRGVGEKQGGRLLASIGDPYWRPELVREDGSVLSAGPRTVSALWAYCGLHVLPAGGHMSYDPQDKVATGGDQANFGQAALHAHADGAGAGADLGQRCRDDAQRTSAGVAPRRARGQRANWSTDARMRVWNIAEACKKQLVKPCTGITADGLAVHVEDCACGGYRLVYDTGRAKYASAVHAVECVRCGPKGKPALIGSPLSPAHQDARALRLVMKEVLKDVWRAAKDHHERENA